MSISLIDLKTQVDGILTNDNDASFNNVDINKNLTLPNYNINRLGLDINGEAVNDNSGYSVSLSNDGTIVAIGAPYNDGQGSNSGHVRVYQYSNSSWSQLGNDINGEGGNNFTGHGKSVSLSSDGLRIAIGAWYNAGNGSRSGHVRIFEYNSNTSLWTQLGSDIDGEASIDYSGKYLSLSSDGTIVAIGANGNDGNGSDSGHVRVFQYSNSSWTQLGNDIDGEAAGDNSGHDVSLSSDGTIVAIGAGLNDGQGNSSGHVRVFQYSNSSWNQLGGDIDGEASGDVSGWSVSLSSDGTIVAIGSENNDGNGADSGHVRVFQYSNSSWTQLGNDIDGEAAGDKSGISVSLAGDGNTVIIGSVKNGDNGIDSGHARIFKYIIGTWTQIGSDINGKAAGDNFGNGVAISKNGSVVAIGAPFNDDSGTNAGQVQLYEIIAGQANIAGVLIQNNDISSVNTITATTFYGDASFGNVDISKELTIINSNIYYKQIGSDIDGEASGDNSALYSSLSLSGDGSIVAIGAIENDGGGNNSGHVRVYQNINSVWTQLGSDIDGENPNDEFGRSISLSSDGTRIAIGAHKHGVAHEDYHRGRVKVYDYDDVTNSWTQLGQDIDGEERSDLSGASISLSDDGTIVAIGAPYNDDGGNNSGHVRIYEYDSTTNTWNQLGSDIDGENNVDYAYNVSLSSNGSIVAIGAGLNNGNGTDSGHVRVYQLTNNSWIQLGTDINGEAAGDNAGDVNTVSLSSDGTILAIGAVYNDGNGSNSGHVRVYQYNSNTNLWIQLGNDIDGKDANYYSGRVSLSSDGTILAIGAHQALDENSNATGHVRIYKYADNSWIQLGSDIYGEAHGDQFGYSLSISSDGTKLAIGAWGNDDNGNNSGHVRVYESIQNNVQINNGEIKANKLLFNDLGEIYATSKSEEKYTIINSQNVEVSGNLIVQGNTTINETAKIGIITSSAAFAHKDNFNTTDYCLRQNSSGDTVLNAAPGRTAYLRNGDSTNIATINNTSFNVNRIRPMTSTNMMIESYDSTPNHQLFMGFGGNKWRKIVLQVSDANGSNDSNIYFVKNGAWKSFHDISSDSRIKLNQELYPNIDSMNIVRTIKVKKYFNTELEREVKGFIAQEVEEILPEAVETHDLSEAGKQSDFKMLDYRRLHVHAFGAIQFLDTLVENQETTINDLKLENTRIKNALNEILSEMGKETIE